MQDENQATSDAAATPAESAHIDTMPSLEAQLKAAELAAAEHHDAWLRAKAETENMRRRAADEAEKARKYAVESFAGEMLAVKDSLEAALADQSASVETLKSGVELTFKQLVSVFEKFKLAEVNPVGEKFDPHLHQAIGMVDAEQPKDTVVHVLQKGYRLNERTLRPAMVMVSKGPAQV